MLMEIYVGYLFVPFPQYLLQSYSFVTRRLMNYYKKLHSESENTGSIL